MIGLKKGRYAARQADRPSEIEAAQALRGALFRARI